MTDDDFKKWKIKHATLFRFGDADLAMIDLWRAVFDSRGFDLHELEQASMELAEHAPKTWRSEHLEYLLTHIGVRRLTRLEMERSEEDRRHEGEDCGLCSGSGLVPVPHPDCVRDNEWVHPWYGCSVACQCFRGNRVLDKNSATIAYAQEKAKKGKDVLVPRRIWALADYERRNPDWIRQMSSKETKQRTEREALQATERADKRHGPMASLVRDIEKRNSHEQEAQTRSSPRPAHARPASP